MAGENTTGRGTKWRILNSWWILLSFIGLAGAGLIYAGKKARKTSWVVAGLIYLLVIGVDLASPAIPAIRDSVIYELCGWILIVGYIAGIIHSFLIRSKYLMRLEYIQANKLDVAEAVYDLRKDRTQNVGTADLRRRFENVVTRSEGDSANTQNVEETAGQTGQQTDAKETEVQPRDISQDMPKVDINKCSVSELVALPGVSAVMAKKAENYRNEHGVFTSVEEFFVVTGMQAHFAERLKGVLVCGDKTEKQVKTSGRRLDF